MTEQQVAEAAVEGASEDDALSAAYDKSQEEDGTPEAEVVEAPEPEQADEEPAEKAEDEALEAPEMPSDLPKEVREVWQEMPEKAREAVLSSQRALSAKLREQGNLVRGIEPIKDVLVEAARQLPALADMKPKDVAEQVFELARISNDFSTKPVETMMGLIKKHGLEAQIGQALQGQPVQTDQTVAELKNTIGQLQRKISELSDPEYIGAQLDSRMQLRDVKSEVEKFAQSTPDWAEYETILPPFIQAVQVRNERMGVTATPATVLKDAYALAKGQSPEAEQQATPLQDVVQVDPQRAAAAKKAKSVNVTSRPTGKARVLTEDELLGRVWDESRAS